MTNLITDRQKSYYSYFKEYVKANVQPLASQWDYNQEMPSDFISKFGEEGFLGSNIPKEFGGQGWDFVTFGLLNEAVGRGTSSLTDLLTIQAMVSMTLMKWGTKEQKSNWLEPLAKGEIIGSFALTEPNVGSDIQNLQTKINKQGDKYIINGSKRWISYGQVANLFLVLGKDNEKSIACLIEKDNPGLQIKPIQNMLGFKAAHMAELVFDNLEIEEKDVIGKPGFALSHIAPIGLHYGRISTACSATGLLRACFEESISYASMRSLGDGKIGDTGTVRRLIASMGTDWNAASLLCHSSCKAEDDHGQDAFEKVQMAKYFSSKAVVRAASDAVQIQGANGCNENSHVARYYRDAKIMEIIEGTTQIYERILGSTFLKKAANINKI